MLAESASANGPLSQTHYCNRQEGGWILGYLFIRSCILSYHAHTFVVVLVTFADLRTFQNLEVLIGTHGGERGTDRTDPHHGN